jgi:hypothetical protein
LLFSPVAATAPERGINHSNQLSETNSRIGIFNKSVELRQGFKHPISFVYMNIQFFILYVFQMFDTHLGTSAWGPKVKNKSRYESLLSRDQAMPARSIMEAMK